MGEHYDHLCAEERGTIMAMTLEGRSVRAIAGVLNRSASTVSRERRRNGWKRDRERGPIGRPAVAGGYDAKGAGLRAARLKRKARRARKLARASALWGVVRDWLGKYYSPEQIAGTLKRRYPGEKTMQVSHETIYAAIYAHPRGRLRRELVALLRQGRGARRPRTRGADRRGKMKDLLSIHLRPPEANERLLPGHWEGDFLKGGADRSAVGTLIDRKTLFVMLAKMEGCDAKTALEGFRDAFSHIDPALRKTLTYDQGKEMALHRALANATGLTIYFADPHSPWQRGIMENTNGLLRQYLPKGTNLARYCQRDLDHIAWALNTRPRKSLGFRTPAEVFLEHCYNERLSLGAHVALRG
jgi:transposase, IS30 family